MFPYSDCSRPDAPDADDGCETNGKNDPDEGDDLCNGHQLSVAEGASATAGESRILPSGDTDVIHVRLNEGNHTCVPLSSQSYHARIEVIAPAGTDLRPGYNFGGSCNNTWRTDLASPICYDWGGTCIADDSKDLYFQIYGQDQANSCLPYQLVVTFAAEGTKVPGCP